MLVFIVAGSLTAAVWMAVLLGWLGPGSETLRERRSQGLASVLVAVVAVGPIVVQILQPRPLVGSQPAMATLASQATALLALALAVCLLLTNRARSLGGFVIGVSLAAGIAVSSVLGADRGFVRGTFYLPIVFVGLSTVYMTRERMLLVIRLSTRTYIYGSLVAAVIAPSWAFESAPGGVELPGLPGRLFGVGFHPNLLGFTAVCAIIAETASPRSRFWRGHVIAALAVVALSGSRTDWAALVAAVLVWSLSRARRGADQLAGFWAAFGLALVGLYVAITLGRETVGNLNNRLPIWRETLSLWRQSPWFGIGPNLYRDTSGVQASETIGVSHAHDQVLQTLAEGGIFGLALLLVVLVLLFQTARRDWHASPMAMATLAAFAAYMFSESPLRVTGASHAMYLDVAVFLLVLQRSLAAGTRRAAVVRETARGALRTSAT